MKHIIKYNKKSYTHTKERFPSINIGDVVVLSTNKKDEVYIAKHCDYIDQCPDNCAVGIRRCVHYYFDCPNYTYLEKMDDVMENL